MSTLYPQFKDALDRDIACALATIVRGPGLGHKRLVFEDRAEAARFVNELLAETDAHPFLTKHDAYDWHLHLTHDDAPLADRIGAEAAMGFLDLIREDQLDRLRTCAADDCEDVLVDLSKNRSKRYCDTGNCGNRTNVAAYRARKRATS